MKVYNITPQVNQPSFGAVYLYDGARTVLKNELNLVKMLKNYKNYLVNKKETKKLIFLCIL